MRTHSYSREDVCTEDECGNRHYARGRCKKHWQRDRRAGVFTVDPDWRRAPKPRKVYRGPGFFITKNGYRKIRVETPEGIRWVLEHRYVMEQMLGRPLLSNENVHHKNGNRQDNNPQNLELWVRWQPNGQRVEDLVAFAHEVLERYG